MSILRYKAVTLDDLQQKEIVEHLCYALCGFDTPSIFIEESVVPGMGVVPVITVDGICESYVDPFKYLIQQVREYSNKEEALIFIDIYLKGISEFKKTVYKIEELYVKVSEYIILFEELDKCFSSSMELVVRGESLVVDEYNRRAKASGEMGCDGFIEWIIKNNLIHKYFDELKFKKTIKSIEKWINNADITNMIEERAHNEFNSCLWKDKFKIKKIKNLDKLQLEMIEECGKIVYFIRAIFKLEVVSDGEEKDMYYRRGGRENEFEGICDELSVIRKIKPLDLSENMISKINQRSFELFCVFNEMLFENICFECDILYNILFLQDFSFHLEIFEEFHVDLLTENNSVIFKMNQFLSERLVKTFPNYKCYIEKHSSIIKTDSLCSCLLSNVLFSEYVSKLLHASFSKNASSYLKVIERFTYSINPGFLQYFLSLKIFTEIKIISRFLFLINIIVYYLEISPKYNFTRILYLIFLRIKNYEIRKVHINGNKIKTEGDVLELVNGLEKQVYDLVQLYYLTNINVFMRFSELIEISIEYIMIEYKEHIDPLEYERRVKEILAFLIKEIKSTNREDYFSEFLERF